MAYWNDMEALGKIARMLPYALIFLGFLVASVWTILQKYNRRTDWRIRGSRTDHAQEHKAPDQAIPRTFRHQPREKDISNGHRERDSVQSTLGSCHREGPTSIAIHDRSRGKYSQRRTTKRFSAEITINNERVVNQYIELRFRYESIYSGELNDPPHLRGEIIKKYRFVDDQILPWNDTAPTDVKG